MNPGEVNGKWQSQKLVQKKMLQYYEVCALNSRSECSSSSNTVLKLIFSITFVTFILKKCCKYYKGPFFLLVSGGMTCTFATQVKIFD